MAEYFDTNVVVALIFPGSTNKLDARRRWSGADGEAFIINHGIAEAYRILTGPLRMTPKVSVELIGEILRRFKVVDMARSDYVAVLEDMAKKNLSGPIVYDALHAHGARNVGATKLHTYNKRHFLVVAPDLNVV